MTVHGHPPFTQWQRAKLAPNLHRAVRNTYGDLVYWVGPAVVAFADAVADLFETMAPYVDQLVAAGEPSPSV